MRTFEVWPPLVWVYAQYLVLFIHSLLLAIVYTDRLLTLPDFLDASLGKVRLPTKLIIECSVICDKTTHPCECGA